MATLAFVAGVLFYWNSAVYLAGVHISLITGTVYAGIVGIAAVIVCAVLPSMRFMMESVAFSRLALALFFLAEPEIGIRLLSNPLLLAIVVVTGGACISRLIHGRIEREPSRLLQFPALTRSAVVAHGNDWQRQFVGWIDGTAPVRVPA